MTLITIINQMPEKDSTGENCMTVSMSNPAIKIIKSALNSFDKYDLDDAKYITQLEQVKTDIHEIWKLANPS